MSKTNRRGYNIIALCRTRPDYKCDFIPTDLTIPESIKKACDGIKTRYTKIDCVINCAGVPGIEELNKITYECLDRTMKINSLAPMYIVSQLFDLIKSSEADIINIGSTIGLKQGCPNQLAYTTSKWAIRGTSYNLQLELAKTKSRVIQLSVGGMNTRMHTKVTGKEIERPQDWMNPGDVADIIFYIMCLPKNIEISDITINRKVL